MNFLFVALGGAIGSIMRYSVSLLTSGTLSVFNVGTIVVNLIGSFLIGMTFAITSEMSVLSPAMRALIFVGIFGGFTTFSSFSLDTFTAFKESGALVALMYVLINNIGGIGLCFLAIHLFSK